MTDSTYRPPVEDGARLYDVPAFADGLECHCGGYMRRVDTTPAERSEYGCGRTWECCARAFECVVCGMRAAGSAESPEME
jgi:hypothetical protein